MDFDQRHTATLNVNMYVPEGDAGFLEMTNVNLLFSFSSGRPYTPLDYFDILSGNNGGPSTTGYVNSRYMSGNFRIDLRAEKAFEIGGFKISPYVWIQNLLDTDNIVNVWRSTGDPYTTGFLNTDEGRAISLTRGQNYVQDYRALERDPANFGIPRLIRLGLKVNLSDISF